MDLTPLSEAEIRAALRDLPGWSFEGDALRTKLTFADHREAMAFLVRLSYESEQRGHHPEILNVYNRVELTLRTHDAGDRVTQADLEMARAASAIRP